MNTTTEDVIIQYSYAGLADTGQCMTCPGKRVKRVHSIYSRSEGKVYTTKTIRYTDKHGKPLGDDVIVWACWVVSTKTVEKP